MNNHGAARGHDEGAAQRSGVPEAEHMCSALVVDDEVNICLGMRRFLEGLGCRVRTTTSGERGLELLLQELPEIVFLDLKMPGMDGVQLLARIREDHPTLPVVIVTGYPDSRMMLEAMHLTPVLLLPKPATQELVENLLKSLGLLD